MPGLELRQAISLREGGDLEETESLLSRVLVELPDDAEANYQMACICDLQGREREALPYYSKTIAEGIAGEARVSAFLGLGSSHRALGEYAEAVEVLRRGVSEFPGERAMQVFLSVALYNAGKHRESVETLLRNLIETTSDAGIKSYKEALDFYSSRLDETWS
ncbi:MAG: tetratricopeptide repeat protein [Rubrobacteraceae bacterium]